MNLQRDIDELVYDSFLSNSNTIPNNIINIIINKYSRVDLLEIFSR